MSKTAAIAKVGIVGKGGVVEIDARERAHDASVRDPRSETVRKAPRAIPLPAGDPAARSVGYSELPPAYDTLREVHARHDTVQMDAITSAAYKQAALMAENAHLADEVRELKEKYAYLRRFIGQVAEYRTAALAALDDGTWRP